MRALVLGLLMLPLPGLADGLKVENAIVPLAPPSAMVHAAYLSLMNDGNTARQVVGVTAGGYAMAHIHRSEIVDDVATMTSVDLVEVAPGQTVVFEHGGLHIMLMKPAAQLSEGDTVRLTLKFTDGTMEDVDATVTRAGHDGHGS